MGLGGAALTNVGVGPRFACVPVVRACVLLLRGYAQNSARTNHCAARLLHRLSRQLRMEALLFQLSLFTLFHRLLSDPSAHQVRHSPDPPPPPFQTHILIPAWCNRAALTPLCCPPFPLQELVALAKFILGKFFALAATNKKAFVELLFWKNATAVREMSEGYSSLRDGEG